MANQLVPWLLCLNVRQAQVREYIQLIAIRKDDRLILYPRRYSLWAWRRGLGEDPAGCLWAGRAGTWPASPRPSGITTAEMQFKEIVLRDFRLLDFFMNQFPPSTWVYHYGHFEFFRKFLEIFAAQGARHQWQMEKIFNQKNFNYFVWTPLGSRVNIYLNFCLQVHFKVSAAWYYCHYAYLPPVSLITVAICHRRHWHRCHWRHWYRWQICQRYQQH